MGWGSKKNPATGRSKREAVNHRSLGRTGGPKRRDGVIVPKGRLQHRRDRKMGKK
jgi:hypothetical protein